MSQMAYPAAVADDLTGQVALVTGGGRGIGENIARELASGRADTLAGRYLHAEHDDVEDLIKRAGEVRENDLNAIRLRR